MTRPSAERLFEALDATWPAARVINHGPWKLREGLGGGQRVSAATANVPEITRSDIEMAELGMRKLEQRPLFMLREGEDVLDDMLEDRRYEHVDPVTLYLAETANLTAELKITDAMPSWPPLAIQLELWQSGGIGPARIAVMDRVNTPQMSLLGRSGDAPAGTVFVALHNDVAMVHGLEVSAEFRRDGVGRRLMHGAANWATAMGASWITLAVTRANDAANGLYHALGMDQAARYHYRRAPESSS